MTTVLGVAIAMLAALGAVVSNAHADTTPQRLPLSQDFTDTSLIASDHDWSLVPGIVAYRGDNMAAEGSDPQLVTADGSNTPVVVYANNTQPSAFNKGGVAEFHRTNQTPPNDTNPAVAFQGNVTSEAPHLVLSLDTTGQSNLRVAYTLRDIDGGSNDSVTPVALQYRVGASGPYTNLPEGFVADATTGPNLAVLDTRVSAALPATANDQPLVQVRIITVNSVTQDEWIGVDYISAFSATPAIDLNGGGEAPATAPPSPRTAAPSPSWTTPPSPSATPTARTSPPPRRP